MLYSLYIGEEVVEGVGSTFALIFGDRHTATLVIPAKMMVTCSFGILMVFGKRACHSA